MQFPFINNSKKIVAIFDVGSDSIGVAIVQYLSPNDPPKILKSFREEIMFRGQLDFMIFMDDMVKTLKSVALNVASSGVGTISDVHIVLSSPWYVSENRHIVVSEKTPFVFTEKISDNLVKSEIEKLKKIHHEKYGGNLDDFNIIEQEIVQIALNGYPVTNPIGKKALSAEMNLIVILSSSTCMNLVKDCISSVFHHVDTYFHSNMSALFIVIREKYMKMDSYLILDLGGEITDVFIVDGGIPKNIISFPYGRQNLYRDLKKELIKNRAEVMSLFSLYLDGSLEENQKIKMEKALYNIQRSWAREFELALMSIPEPRMIPNSVFLVMNKDVHPMFFQMFAEKNDFIYKIFKNECNVLGLNGPDFLGLCRVDDGLCDPMLMIQALSVKRKYVK